MTRTDFALIAQTIRDLPESPEVRERVAREFCRVLMWQHPRFKRSVFLAACGVEYGEGAF